MPAPLTVTPHLTVEEVEKRYRAATDAVEARQWQVILLMSRGERTARTAAVTTLSRDWMREVIHRYHQDGPDGIGDRRHKNPGAKSPLTAEVLAELHGKLAQASPDGGVWSGPKVAAWLSERLGQPVDPKKAWRWMREEGYVLRRPRPRHAKTSLEDQLGKVQA
jgi:transposase